MDIKRDRNILKFSYYGFFKNLKFFEPFLYIFLLEIGLSFLQIGMLISIREISKNIFEIPSGIFADNYGKKDSLKLCFVFYMISFVLFYFSYTFVLPVLAMIFFGLGEAFRSGTHKAIIFTYLSKNGLDDKKVEVYGQTKSYSLVGSALSALLGGFIVFVESNYRLIFLISLLPYIIDFLLINSYPDYLDKTTNKGFNLEILWKAAINSFNNLFKIKELRKGLINSSIYDGYFKVLKDYLQPLLKNKLMLISLGVYSFTENKKMAILLGLSYFIINLLTSYTTRNSYKLKNFFNIEVDFLNISFLLTVFIIALIGICYYLNLIIAAIFIYLFFYILRHSRRTFMLEYISCIIAEKERATMLSLESQLRTLFIIIFAPLMGVVADLYSLWIMFVFAFLSMFVLYLFTVIER